MASYYGWKRKEQKEHFKTIQRKKGNKRKGDYWLF